MNNQWIAKSLTVWGVVISVLMGLVPALSLVFPDLSQILTPEWIAVLNDAAKTTITSVGVLVGSVMVVVDRVSGSGEVKKALVFRPSEE